MRGCVIALLFMSQCLWAQEWTELALQESNGYLLKATSELAHPDVNNNWYNKPYGVQNLVDGDFATAWVEGAEGNGVGQSVFVSLPNDCRTISLHGGYGKSADIFAKNNRLKRIKLSCYVGVNPTGYISELAMVFKTQKFSNDYYINLNDVDSIQVFPIPFEHEVLKQFENGVKQQYLKEHSEPIFQISTILQIEIVDIYKGSKYDDTCISELHFSDSYVPDYRLQKHSKVLSVYVGEPDESKILIDTPKAKGIVVLDEPESVFQVIDVSEDNCWVTIIRMPAEVGEGRVETEYLVFNTHLGKILNVDIEKSVGVNLYDPLFLVSRNSETILEYPQGEVVLR